MAIAELKMHVIRIYSQHATGLYTCTQVLEVSGRRSGLAGLTPPTSICCRWHAPAHLARWLRVLSLRYATDSRPAYADIHTKYGVISRLLDDHPPVEPQSVCPGRGACLQHAADSHRGPLGQERSALVGTLAVCQPCRALQPPAAAQKPRLCLSSHRTACVCQ